MHGRADTGTRLAALALAWLAGVALHLQQRMLWPIEGYGLALAIGAALLIVAWRWRRAYALGLVGALLIALGASGTRASVRLADALPA
ncbi:MAG: hypothetical protein H7Y61_14075, partial [Rhizobiales bacterium]|nr:hypothetical protein [Rhizobacter sp.]